MRYPALTLLVLVTSSVALFANAGTEKDEGAVKALQAAEWGWAREESIVSCENNRHIIRFNAGLTEAVFEFRKPIDAADGTRSRTARYNILKRDGNAITMQIVGEKRLDPQGRPVVWDLLLLDERTYTWHRHDWPEGGHTPYVHRCK